MGYTGRTPECVRGADVSLGISRGAGTDLPRRRLTPAPCRVHAGDPCACTRPAAGWIAQRAGSVPAPQVVRRSTAPPTNVRKTRSSCSDLLSLLALLAEVMRSTFSRSTMSGSDSFMEHCGSATAHQRRCGTASVLTIVRDGRASAARTCQQHAHAWLMSRGLSEFSCRLRHTHHWEPFPPFPVAR